MRSLAGTGALLRLALRRDRLRLPIWVMVLTSTVVGTAAAFQELYPTVASRQLFALSIASNPAVVALIGPPFDLTSIGGLTAWRTGSFGAVLAGVMSLMTVIRHTRAEEEAGRLELVGSGVVGRYASLTSALLLSFGTNLVLALAIAGGLIGSGLPLAGSIALGFSLGAAGMMLAAVAAVASQLTGGARTATGIAAAVLGLSFTLRAAGDTAGEGGPSWLSWLSTIGWTQQTRSFADERWWVFGLAGGFVVALVAIAYTLVAHRDLGAGLLPSRLGPAEGAPSLRSPLALAWLLQRGSIAGWAVGFALAGSAFGAMAEGIGDLLESSPQLEDIFSRMGVGSAIVDVYLSATMGIVGLLASVYAVQGTLRLRSEETSLRAEPVLATSVERIRWALSHLTLAAMGVAIVLIAAGLTAGVAHGVRTGDLGGQVPRLVGAAVVQLPAAWVLAGLALALYGLAPHFTVASWGALVVFLLLAQLGPMLQLDQLVMNISPFTHVPQLPGSQLTATPLLWLSGVAAALAAAGLLGFRQRDVG